MPQHPSFLDITLDRREQLLERIEKASGSLQTNIEAVRQETLKKLKEMRAFTDASGKIIRNEASERAIQAQINSLDAFMRREEVRGIEKLFKQRERAFIESATSVKFAVDEATAGRAKISTSFSQIFEEAARVSKNSTVLGLNPRMTLRGTFKDQQKRVSNILTNSIIKGERLPDTAKKINKASGIGMRSATRVARTNLNASTADADRMIYDSDPEVFAGYKWDATFDSRTSAICASLHGRFYPLGSRPPGPPAHWNCRSTLEPVFRDEAVEEFAKEGGRRVRGFKKDGEQSKQDRIIAGDTSFNSWMRKQPSSVTRKITGSDLKNSLFRQNQIQMNDIVGNDLLPRSDKAVLQRALARNPSNKRLQKLARELDVKKKSIKDILKADDRIARQVRHTVPRPFKAKDGLDCLCHRRGVIEDLKKKKRRDAVTAAGKRQAKVNAKKAAEVDIIPIPPKSLLDKVEKELEPILKDAARKLGVTVEEVRLRLDRHLAGLLDDADVFIRVPDSALEQILKDGRIKNQFETGASRGIFSPETRRIQENGLFGTANDTPLKERPIYGYSSSSKTGFVKRDPTLELNNYGDVAIKLKRDVRGRATVTFDDSLSQAFSAPSKYTNPSIRGLEPLDSDELLSILKDRRADSILGGQYTEVQFHGGLTLDDVDEIIFNSGQPSDTLKAAMRRKNVTWSVDLSARAQKEVERAERTRREFAALLEKEKPSGLTPLQKRIADQQLARSRAREIARRARVGRRRRR